MRSCVIYLVLLSSLVCAQTGSIKVKVSKGDRRNKELWNTTFLFNHDTSFLESRSVFRNKSIFDSVPYGEYYVVLMSDLGEKIKKSTNLKAQNTKLKVSEHKHYYSKYRDRTPFISLLKNGDTMTIYFIMYGCFGGYSDRADINYSNNIYTMRYTSQMQKDTILSRTLDSNKIKTLLQFEERSFKPASKLYICTNQFYYTIQLGSKVYFTTRSCYDLIEKLAIN